MIQLMKRHLLSALAAVIALAGLSSPLHAAKVRLEGSGYYELGKSVDYDGNGKKQSGRKYTLGANFYHSGKISMEWIINRSGYKTGDLSFEFWGMPYYGATSGKVLMTRSLDRLSPYDDYHKKYRKGDAVFLDQYRFPEINIWEFTSNGWRFRDALSFKRKNLL